MTWLQVLLSLRMTKRLPGMEGPSWEGLSMPAIRIRQGSSGGQTSVHGTDTWMTPSGVMSRDREK
jgi:hypothetical protein